MPIQILPARLANQIAAGEVVERPASVVKEMVENSLDAGATSIDINIEKGGHKRILINDNGHGIAKDELALALSRHATSKIAKLDDLEAICSLGFRGEALASISSVARLTLSSKPEEQTQAWQAHCEGRDMQVQLNPVAHPKGTSVDVSDLFFNTPARRKFLRTEKTEFTHIDEVVRRIALSRFDVSFSLKHNGKLLRKYPAAATEDKKLKRISAICGKDFAEQAIELNSQYQEFELTGWLAQPEQAKSQADFQYFYVNGRMMRDKLINHAVRQAFEGLIAPDLFPAYVLYLTLSPEQVDVNVHPAKHEVRFHQARLVHDFIYRALTDALNQYFQQGQSVSEPQVLPQAEPNHDYIQPLQQDNTEHKALSAAQPRVTEQPKNYGTSPLAAHSSFAANKVKRDHQVNSAQVMTQASDNYQQLMTAQGPVDKTAEQPTQLDTPTVETKEQWLRINKHQILIKASTSFYLLSIQQLYLKTLSLRYQQGLPISQPLLMPISITATSDLLAHAKKLYQPLLENNLEIGWTPNRIILRKVPADFRQFRWSECLESVLECANTDAQEVREHILTCIAARMDSQHSQIQTLWQELVSATTDLTPALNTMAQPIPLQNWIDTYVDH